MLHSFPGRRSFLPRVTSTMERSINRFGKTGKIHLLIQICIKMNGFHLPPMFCWNLFCCFCVILLTNRWRHILPGGVKYQYCCLWLTSSPNTPGFRGTVFGFAALSSKMSPAARLHCSTLLLSTTRVHQNKVLLDSCLQASNLVVGSGWWASCIGSCLPLIGSDSGCEGICSPASFFVARPFNRDTQTVENSSISGILGNCYVFCGSGSPLLLPFIVETMLCIGYIW